MTLLLLPQNEVMKEESNVVSLLSCLMVGIEESLHSRAKVSFSFIQGEKSTRRTNPLSDPLSCLYVIPAFYVTALFMFTFD